MTRLPRSAAFAVALVAGSTIAVQVVLTRLLGAVLFYHFAFFAISLALLGTGIGALLVYLWPERVVGSSPQRAMGRWAVLLTVALAVAPLVLVRLNYYSAGIEITWRFAATLLLAALTAAVPLTLAGVLIAIAVRTYVDQIDRLYAADLAGAAAGAFVVVPLLWVVDVPVLLASLAGLSAIAALLLSAGRERRRVLTVALVIGVGVVVCGVAGAYHLPGRFEGGRVVAADDWTPISRVIGYKGGPKTPAVVTYDQDLAPVPLRRPGDPPLGWRALGLGPQSIAFALAPRDRALIIGGGGGRDINNALSAGEEDVDVIELNRRIRDVVDGPLRPWSGAPYTRPHVHTVAGDGRATLARRSTRYGVINLGFTNTLTAGTGQGYALAENNLYTIEAFREYLDHLEPRGILSVSRLYRFAGDEALRATLVTLAALKQEGVRDPRRNVVVMLGRDALGADFGTVLARREPWGQPELARIQRLARARARMIVLAPGLPGRREWTGLARTNDLDAFCSGYVLNVCPPDDNKPFFLNAVRLGDLGKPLPPGSTFIARDPFVVLLVALGILTLLSLVGLLLPLFVRARATRPPVPQLAYFLALGVGFIALEIVLIQRFVLLLGFPTYALSVVLFSLLLSTGAGAWWSGRWSPEHGLRRALTVVVVLSAAAALGLGTVIHALIDLPFVARVACAIALIAPLGFFLGMCMPLGLRRLAASSREAVPWAWSINGLGSVFASVLATFVALNWGFRAATWLGCGCYVGALLLVRARGSRTT